jgi:hypothetical protein
MVPAYLPTFHPLPSNIAGVYFCTESLVPEATICHTRLSLGAQRITGLLQRVYCGRMKVCQKAGCARRSRRKRTSKWERESAQSGVQKELYVCVCVRHTLCTCLARLPCGSITIGNLLGHGITSPTPITHMPSLHS